MLVKSLHAENVLTFGTFDLRLDGESLVQLAVFVRTAVLAPLIQEASNGDEALRVQLAQWVENELTVERLAERCEGTLVPRHVGMAHMPWPIRYEFSCDGADYAWILAGPNMCGRHPRQATTRRYGDCHLQPPDRPAGLSGGMVSVRAYGGAGRP